MKAKTVFYAEIHMDIEGTVIDELITTAVEGGSGYWAAFPKYDHREIYKVVDGDEEFLVVDHEDGEKKYLLSQKKIKRGLQAMAEAFPNKFRKMAEGDYDADDADAFLQFCLFGKLVYG